jgi:hypothetical protein
VQCAGRPHHSNRVHGLRPIAAVGKLRDYLDCGRQAVKKCGCDTVSDLVVELSNPQLSGNDLSYDVKVLEGTLPGKGGACALFIDIIGMPRTPYSFAGAARRGFRRGY